MSETERQRSLAAAQRRRRSLGLQLDVGPLAANQPVVGRLSSSPACQRRRRLDVPLPPSSGKRVPERGRPAKAASAKKKAAPAKASTPKGPSLDDRVQAFLESRPMDWFAAKEVMDAIKEPPGKAVSLAFARLCKHGRIARREDGRYAARKN